MADGTQEERSSPHRPIPTPPEVQEKSLEATLKSFHYDYVLLLQTKNIGKHNDPRSHCLFLNRHELPVIVQTGNGSSDMSRDHRKSRSQVDGAFSFH